MKRFVIRRGNVYNCKTYIYIMQDINGCKFGITNCLERRKNQYSETRPTLVLKYFRILEERNLARLIEYKMKLHFPIIKELGFETTSAPLEDIINFIENSNFCFEKAILELPEHLRPL